MPSSVPTRLTSIIACTSARSASTVRAGRSTPALLTRPSTPPKRSVTSARKAIHPDSSATSSVTNAAVGPSDGGDLAPGLEDIGDHDGRAALGQSTGDGGALAAGGTGHHHDPILELVHLDPHDRCRLRRPVVMPPDHRINV